MLFVVLLLDSLVVPDSCICSRKLSYVNVIVYLYSICKKKPTVIGFYTVVVILPLFYVVKLKYLW
jgi:hypothetical protein